VNAALPNAFSEWESFYVIVGSSAAALTGLQFVVVALMADARRKSTSDGIGAFATPTVVHFCAAFLVAAVLSAPWRAISSAAIVLGVVALTGICYAALVARRARRQTGYTLVLEDWVWHIALPIFAYAALLSAALTLTRDTEDALFGIATGTILLLFIGIHNAWDTAVYVTDENTAPALPDAGTAASASVTDQVRG
jgi:hypothetical protein